MMYDYGKRLVEPRGRNKYEEGQRSIAMEAKMNLIKDAWLQGVCRDGSLKLWSPLDVSNPDWIDLHFIRSDFRGAMYQFLIGLLQMAFPPENKQDWIELLKEPPSREELEEALKPYERAFELLSDEAAFMQDFDVRKNFKNKKFNQLNVEDLLIDKGSDINLFFNKSIQNAGFCFSCFAQALFTLQINAPSGGRSTMASVRGARGPLTTLLMPEKENTSMWEKLWLNVLHQKKMRDFKVSVATDGDIAKILPWMTNIRTSDGAKAQVTTPEMVHKQQVYWAMPRRIRVDKETIIENGCCTLCGAQNQPLIQNYYHRHGGINYDGAWIHPLTPHKKNKDKEYIPMSGKEAAKGYGNWLDLLLGQSEQSQIAHVVYQFRSESFKVNSYLWCFGYAMSNAKALCWYESSLPIHHIREEFMNDFRDSVSNLINAANKLAQLLHKQVKAAWFENPKDAGSEPMVYQSFWENTEVYFYEALDCLSNFDFKNNSQPQDIYQNWLKSVYAKTMQLFDYWVMRGDIEEMKINRVVQARVELLKLLNSSKEIRYIKGIKMEDARENKKKTVKEKVNPVSSKEVQDSLF